MNTTGFQTNKHLRNFLLAIAIVAPFNMLAQQKRDIHEMFDKSESQMKVTRASDVISINLSEFEETTTYTLSISDGNTYRFYGGKLAKITNGEWEGGPLIEISNNSRVIFDTGAIIDGGNLNTEDPVIKVTSYLELTGGSITGVYGWSNPTVNSTGKTAVKMDSDGASLIMSSGTIAGRVDNNNTQSHISLFGGTVYRVSTGSDVLLSGSAKILTNLYFYSQTAKVILNSAIQNSLYLSNYVLGQCVVSKGSYTPTNSDMAKITLGNNTNSYILSLEGSNIFVRAKPSADDYKYIDDVHPGDLPNRIPESVRDQLTELHISGYLNGTDIKFLRELGNMKLRILDIYKCFIVSGGESYYSLYSTNYTTKNDVIGSYFFYDCNSLEKIMIPATITSIERNAFASCSALTELTLASTVSSIGIFVWSGDTKLTTVDMKGNNYFVLEKGILYNKAKTEVVAALPAVVSGDITLPSSVKKLYWGAFGRCSMMTNIKLPDGLIETGHSTFSSCKGLTNVDISNIKATELSFAMFSMCSNLTKISLPASATVIGWEMLFYCSKLTDIYCYAVKAPTPEDNKSAFENVNTSTCKIHVPKGSISSYKSTNYWKDFKNIVEDLTGNNNVDDYTEIKDLQPGTLPDRIPEDVRDQLSELTISGKLNGTDIRLIRSMAKSNLKRLDISACSIVKGGEYYYDDALDGRISASRAMSPNKSIILIRQQYGTEDNTVGFYMFGGCTSLETLILPETVTTIKSEVFRDCSNLRNLTIGSAVSMMDVRKFDGCTVLTKLVLKNTKYYKLLSGIIYNANSTVLNEALPAVVSGTIDIPTTVDSISMYAFYKTNITKVIIPQRVKNVSSYSFYGCTSLKEAVFNMQAAIIDKYAFQACSSLSSIVFTGLVTSIGRRAFEGAKMAAVELPEGLKTVESFAFSNISSLKSVSLPATLEKLEHGTFANQSVVDIYSKNVIPPTLYWHNPKDPHIHVTDVVGDTDINDATFTFNGVNTATCRVHVPRGSVSSYKNANGWHLFTNYVEDLPGLDPNYITDELSLQQRLDEIANEKPVEAVKLIIRDEGISLSQHIVAKSGCKVIIKGGAITVDATHFSADMVFTINQGANVTFDRITIDFGGLGRPYFYYFNNRGRLTINEEVFFKNIYTGATEGYFYSNRDEGVMNINSGSITLNGTVLYTEGVVSLAYDGLKTSSSTKPAIMIAKNGVINTGNSSVWTTKTSVSADWTSLAQNQEIVLNLSEQQFNNIIFTGIPDDRHEVQYVSTSKYARYHHMNLAEWFKKKNEADKDTGTEENPVVVEMPDYDNDNGDLWEGDELEIGRESGGKTRCVHYWWRDHDWRIVNGWPWRPTLRLNTNIRIYRGSSLRLSQFYLSGMDSDKYVYVYGTLIIDVDVYIRYFKYRFIHVMPGGKVIWRGKHIESVGHLIYNEGGTVEYLDGDGEYQGSDYAFVNTSTGSMTIGGGMISGGVANNGGGSVTISGGTIRRGSIAVVQNGGGRTTINGGWICGFYPRGGTKGGYETPDIDVTGGSLWLSGGTIGEQGDGIVRTTTDLWLGGEAKLGHVWMSRPVRIHIISQLTVLIRFHFFLVGDFDIDIPIIIGDNGYILTENDLKMISIDLPDDYTYVLKEGTIIITKRKKRDIHDLFNDAPKNNDEDDPYNPDTEDGVDVNTDTTLPDIHVLFGSKDGSKKSGPFVIGNNATLTVHSASATFSHIEVKGSGNAHVETTGKVVVGNGTVVSGFNRFIDVKSGGSVVWDGGMSDGVSTVINNLGGSVELLRGKIGGIVRSTTDVTASGNVAVNMYELQVGRVIRVTSQITQPWTITLMEATGNPVMAVNDGTIVVEGSDGYELSEADLQYVTGELPAGYYLVYDVARKAIIVSSTLPNAIVEVDSGTADTKLLFDLQGRKVINPAKPGIYVKNGRKVVLK